MSIVLANTSEVGFDSSEVIVTFGFTSEESRSLPRHRPRC